LLLGQPILLWHKSKDLYHGFVARFSPTQAPTQIAWFSGLLKSVRGLSLNRGRLLYRPRLNRQLPISICRPPYRAHRTATSEEARIIRGFKEASTSIFRQLFI